MRNRKKKDTFNNREKESVYKKCKENLSKEKYNGKTNDFLHWIIYSNKLNIR